MKYSHVSSTTKETQSLQALRITPAAFGETPNQPKNQN